MMLALKDAGRFRTSHFILYLGEGKDREDGRANGLLEQVRGPWRSDWDLYTPSVPGSCCLYPGNEMGYGMRVGYQGPHTKGSLNLGVPEPRRCNH